ncbi:hypothetical protein GEMRC1_009905 [Eukaryota sp. GEM-RC1]
MYRYVDSLLAKLFGGSSVTSPSTHSPPNILRFQQSLLVLIHLHFLNHLLEHSSHWDRDDFSDVLNLKKDLPKFFKKLGYMSDHFFESSLLATKVFFQTNTFHVLPKDLPQLFPLSSFFKADPKSIFLHVDKAFNVEDWISYSPIISGLELDLKSPNDLEFVNNPFLFFPRVKQLRVRIRRSICLVSIESLKANTTVTSISLRNNSIKEEGIASLVELLKVNTTIKSIDLGMNSLGAESARALAELLKVNTTIKGINLWKNSFRPEGAKVLARSLKVNNTLTSCNLGWNNIRAEGAREFAKTLKVNNTVTRFSFYNNSLGVEGVRLLAMSLKVNTTLKSAEALAEALKVNATITSVALETNYIGAEGARALANALKVNTTVTYINFEGNLIRDEGATALAEALNVNSTVRYINLSYNYIKAEGGRALAETLKVNTTVEIEGINHLLL